MSFTPFEFAAKFERKNRKDHLITFISQFTEININQSFNRQSKPFFPRLQTATVTASDLNTTPIAKQSRQYIVINSSTMRNLTLLYIGMQVMSAEAFQQQTPMFNLGLKSLVPIQKMPSSFPSLLANNNANHNSSTKKSGLRMSSTSEEEPSKCPVTIFSLNVQKVLTFLDKNILKPILKITNHAPALLSLSYFGLVSMASMMSMGPMSNTGGPAEATIASVLTKTVGSTTNAQFAALFPTFVTPAPFVFLVWPTIAILQLLTVSVSAIYPSDQEEILTQKDLSALTLANLASTAWLLSASNAMDGALPISSVLILPLVPLFSGYTLRNKPSYVLWAYQLFSSFTTLASFLALTVELQHGGRIPIIGKLPAELAACVFLSLYSAASLGVKEKSSVKKFVNFFALSGILVRRVGAVCS